MKSGLVYGYTHQGRVGVLVEVSCETDFVAKILSLRHCVGIALQVASMEPKDVRSFLSKTTFVMEVRKLRIWLPT